MQKLLQRLPTQHLAYVTPLRTLTKTNAFLPFILNVRFATQGPGKPNYPDMVKLVQEIRQQQLPSRLPTPAVQWAKNFKQAQDNLINIPISHAYSGRSVTNHNGSQLAGTFKALDVILSRNKVRKELRLNERHEKKGVKRRRLSSERWRNQFSKEVGRKVGLVIKIRNRGA